MPSHSSARSRIESVADPLSVIVEAADQRAAARHHDGELAVRRALGGADVVRAVHASGQCPARAAPQAAGSRGRVKVYVSTVRSLGETFDGGPQRVIVSLVGENSRQGVTVAARDAGPGIPDLERALQDGYSGYGGMGLGLPGSRRLMDEFEITSEVDFDLDVTIDVGTQLEPRARGTQLMVVLEVKKDPAR